VPSSSSSERQQPDTSRGDDATISIEDGSACRLAMLQSDPRHFVATPHSCRDCRHRRQGVGFESLVARLAEAYLTLLLYYDKSPKHPCKP
jgi:hypothetical protein